MNKTNLGRILILLGIGLGFVTAAEGLKAQGRGKTQFYVETGPGQYRLEAVYSVDPQVALRAYELDPAASKAGSGMMYLKSGDDEARQVGSASGFKDFLDSRYSREPHLANEAPCDATINLAFNLTCNFRCPSVGNSCTGQLGLGATLTCNNNPPCPVSKDCIPFLGRLTGVTTNQQACACNGPMGACALQGGTTVTGVIASGPLCDCIGANSTDVPTLSLWAWLAATLLILVIGITLLRRRDARA